MSNRREFITLLGGAAAAWPLAARGQQPEPMKRIGLLTDAAQTDQFALSVVSVFRQRLEALGWNDGRNVRIDERWAALDGDRLRVYSTELVGLKPDAVFGIGTPVIAALQRASRSIPIIFMNANNPIGSGFVASMARPGGNITGFVSYEPTMGGKWLETLREIAPHIMRVGLLYNPQTHTGQHFQSIEFASRSLGVKAVRLPFREANEIEHALGDYAREAGSGLVVLPDNSTNFHRDLIVTLAARHRLPAIYPFRRFVVGGGLAYYGAYETDTARKAAEYVDRILKGAKPADLPVQAPTNFELVINLKTAKALGLEVPPMLLARADEVIE
jgi:putative ABC transport system substrate-binding protein